MSKSSIGGGAKVTTTRQATGTTAYVGTPVDTTIAVDNRKWCPAIMWQNGNHCVPHATCFAMEYVAIKLGGARTQLSRLQNYYDARATERLGAFWRAFGAQVGR